MSRDASRSGFPAAVIGDVDDNLSFALAQLHRTLWKARLPAERQHSGDSTETTTTTLCAPRCDHQHKKNSNRRSLRLLWKAEMIIIAKRLLSV